MLGELLALGVAFAQGGLTLSLVWPLPAMSSETKWLRAVLSAGLGIGVSSLVYFGSLLCGVSTRPWLVVLDVALVAGLSAAAVWVAGPRRRHSTPPTLAAAPHLATPACPSACGAARAAFGLSLLAGAVVFLLWTLARPHGGWDAWAIYNLRARFLFESGQLGVAVSPLLEWSRIDYPLLVPCAVARVWSYSGEASLLAPALISGVYTFGCVAVLALGLGSMGAGMLGCCGGALLALTPAFIAHGTSQYADVPLAFYLLSTLVLMYRGSAAEPEGYAPRLWALAGLCSGLGAWTKNEGIVCLSALCVAHFLWTQQICGHRWRRLACYMAGAAPALAGICLLKSIAPANYLLRTDALQAIPGRLVDVSRYRTVGSAFVHEALGFGDWIVGGPAWVLLAAALFGFRASRKETVAAVALMGILLVYALVYLVTPFELEWQLKTSLNRLLIHVFPAALFVALLAMRREGGNPVGAG